MRKKNQTYFEIRKKLKINDTLAAFVAVVLAFLTYMEVSPCPPRESFILRLE